MLGERGPCSDVLGDKVTSVDDKGGLVEGLLLSTSEV